MRQKRRKEISDDQQNQNQQDQQVESDSGHGQRRTAHDGQRCRTGRDSGVPEGCLEEGYQPEEEGSPGPQKGHGQSRQTS